MVTKRKLLEKINLLEDRVKKLEIDMEQAKSIAGFKAQQKQAEIRNAEQIMNEYMNGEEKPKKAGK